MIRKVFEAKAERDGPRTFRFTISTRAVDRDNDTINPQGWDLLAYRAAPVVLWSHDTTVPAIARTVEIGVVGGALKATAEFPEDGLYPFADQVRRLLAEGYLSSASVGFRPLEKAYNADRGGWDFKRQELLEWSICNVGALPVATVERRGAGINLAAVNKWLNGRGVGADEIDLAVIEDDESDLPMLGHADVLGALRSAITEQAEMATGAAIARQKWARIGPDEHVLELDDEVEARLTPDDVRAALREGIGAAVAEQVAGAIRRARGRID